MTKTERLKLIKERNLVSKIVKHLEKTNKYTYLYPYSDKDIYIDGEIDLKRLTMFILKESNNE